MIRQRPEGTSPVVRAVAEALPLCRHAVLAVHHRTGWGAGLRRIAPRQVVLAYDPRLHAEFWFVREYVPEIAELELSRPSADDIAGELGAPRVVPLPVPWDFTDGVFPAHWRLSRPPSADPAPRSRRPAPPRSSVASPASARTGRPGGGRNAIVSCSPGPSGTPGSG
ncbi:hypothetical protein [Amycolatopsis sulphurea]|uniref:hypothetical protein n=1 Tax=Amycolatopsis sulphurea TaxID=76022 RepID=UPI001FE75C63|nr:hypothetical protein [Amycolatopsis sulphurea]